MIPILLTPMAPTIPAIIIDVDCGGGIRPFRRHATLSGDGAVTVTRFGSMPVNARGRVEPAAVLRLSARLDKAGFDQVQTPRPKFQVYDGVTCAIGRRNAAGYHRIVLAAGVDLSGRTSRALAAINAVLIDSFALSDSVVSGSAPGATGSPPIAGSQHPAD